MIDEITSIESTPVYDTQISPTAPSVPPSPAGELPQPPLADLYLQGRLPITTSPSLSCLRHLPAVTTQPCADSCQPPPAAIPFLPPLAILTCRSYTLTSIWVSSYSSNPTQIPYHQQQPQIVTAFTPPHANRFGTSLWQCRLYIFCMDPRGPSPPFYPCLTITVAQVWVPACFHKRHCHKDVPLPNHHLFSMDPPVPSPPFHPCLTITVDQVWVPACPASTSSTSQHMMAWSILLVGSIGASSFFVDSTLQPTTLTTTHNSGTYSSRRFRHADMGAVQGGLPLSLCRRLAQMPWVCRCFCCSLPRSQPTPAGF